MTTIQRKAFVLLSGGMDSTTCLYKAINDYGPQDKVEAIYWNLQGGDCGSQRDIGPIDWVEAFSIDYGQRHKKEMEYASETCKRLGIKHSILDVGKLLGGATVMLSAESIGSVSVPDISYGDIKGVSPTYVPYRNGLLLSAITAQAQKWVNEQIQSMAEGEYLQHEDANDKLHQDIVAEMTSAMKDSAGVYFGAHSEDAANWAYPDCTPEFIGSQANAIYVGTYFCIRLHTPLQWLMKSEIVELGTKLGVDFANTWSCYKGETLHCGGCPTCRSRKEAFVKAGVKDPTEYSV